MKEKNQVNARWQDKELDKFIEEGAITISLIPRVKGNEANIQLRNQLFVRLTGSKGWANLLGIGDYPMCSEINNVISSGDTFTFEFKRAPLQIIDEND